MSSFERHLLLNVEVTNYVYCSLFQSHIQTAVGTSDLNNAFTFMEVSKVVDSCKKGEDYSDIPNEAAKNQSAKTMLYHFFSLCFVTGRSLN